MPNLKELDINKELKIKVLLKGYSATGKSFLCAKIAGTLATEGCTVLYLDQEKGAMRELKNLTTTLSGDDLGRIYFEKFKDFKELDNWLEYYKKMDDKKDEKDRIKLIIIDPMPLTELVRASVRDALVEQGHYYIGGWGEATKKIDNEDLFELRGSMYSIANTWAWNFLNQIANSEYDLVCTLMYPTETQEKKYKYRSEYDGKFDYVYETIAERDTSKILYKATIVKKRGCLTPILTRPIENLLGEITGLFEEKYDFKQKVEQKAEKTKTS